MLHSSSRRFGRVFGLLVTLALATALAVFAAPTHADAQTTDAQPVQPTFQATPCAAPFEDAGSYTLGPDVVYACVPAGSTAVNAVSVCEGNAFVLVEGPFCGVGGASVIGGDCTAPAKVLTQTSPQPFLDSLPFFEGSPVCHISLYTDAVLTVQVEEYLVGAPACATMAELMSGEADPVALVCAFGCVDGFDANCDGTLGDFCDPALDTRYAAGAMACLAALADADDAPAAEPASVPAPVAVPVASGGSLAHTGAESSVLAFFGFGALAFGATALGVRRRMADEA